MAKNCLSCGMPLNEKTGYSGKTDFCIFCTDEKGNLKSYNEVLTGIASWLRSSDRIKKNTNYHVRASEYLKSMPAWASHKSVDTDNDKVRLFEIETPESCQSCGIPFSDNTVKNGMFCSFCSDDKGKLKTREELLTAFELWLKEISPVKEGIDFRERAAHYLNAMHAWS